MEVTTGSLLLFLPKLIIERRKNTMGRYIVSKSPVIRMDLMVKKEFQPQLVSYIERTGCTYEREDYSKPIDGSEWVCLKNVQGKTGWNLGELLGLFYSLEWGSNTEERVDKFYVILNAKKKGKKKNVCINRKEAGSGRKGGNAGETTGDIQPGQNDGSCRGADLAGDAGVDDSGDQPGLPSTCDGRCE